MSFYSRLVAKTRDLLFGWIPVPWLDLSVAEAHILILLAIVIIPALRALAVAVDEFQVSKGNQRDPWSHVVALAVSLAALLALAIVLLLIPDPWGSVAVLLVAVGVGWLWIGAGTFADSVYRREFFLNLGAVLGLALVAVLISRLAG